MKKTLLLTIFATLFLCITAQAQEGEREHFNENEGVFAALSARLANSEKQSEKMEKALEYLKIYGFLQGMYEWSDDKNGNASTGTSSFSVYRARVILTGDFYKSKRTGATLNYWFYFDFARLPDNPFLDLRIRYHLSDKFNLIVGHLQNPFHFQDLFRPSKFEFIDYSYAAARVAKMGGTDVTSTDVKLRELGFRVFGELGERNGYNIFHYSAGVLSSIGVLQKNNNESADFFCRLAVKPSHNLAFSLYGQWGEGNFTKVKENNPQKYADFRWSGNSDYVRTARWGTGFSYITKTLYMRGDYIAGLTGNLPTESAYLECGYKHHFSKDRGFAWAGAMVDYYCYNTFDYIKRNTAIAPIDLRYTLSVGWEPCYYYRIQLAYSLEQCVNYTFNNNRRFANSLKLLVTAAW